MCVPLPLVDNGIGESSKQEPLRLVVGCGSACKPRTTTKEVVDGGSIPSEVSRFLCPRGLLARTRGSQPLKGRSILPGDTTWVGGRAAIARDCKSRGRKVFGGSSPSRPTSFWRWPRSSVVERSALDRLDAGSNPADA